MHLTAYLAQDRMRALAGGKSLPDRTSGSALFADISGFTPLTEVLTQQMGARQGIEELTRRINLVYETLISISEQHGGSVISFAGDSITCWFDGGESQEAAQQAVCCAFAMQAAMHQHPALGIKITVASGPARRFLVGNPEIHYLDVLAGAIVARIAAGEQLAQRGEVLVDEATAQALEPGLSVSGWRESHGGSGKVVGAEGGRFAVAVSFRAAAPSAPPEPVSPPEYEISPSRLRPFIHPVIYNREPVGQNHLLTAFRPCVAMFVRFTAIDYDSDQAQPQLDALVRRMQAVIHRYGGALLELTIGDKGSYAYINFGALTAYEDNARRAVKAALELHAEIRQEMPALQLQTGLTQGIMRVGAYGGSTRSSFSAMGHEVNLSSRLMQAARPGEILVSSAVQKSAGANFIYESHSWMQVKGNAEPLPVFAVGGERRQRAIRLQEPPFALPMVGRAEQMEAIEARLDLARQGQAQVIAVVAEAGLGKSRLVAEAIRSARKKGFAGYGGACQSDGLHTPYLPWKLIWNAFFNVDPSAPLRKQARLLEGELEDRAPARADALPLLGTLLDLPISDNEFTTGLSPANRQSALHVLLEDCLKSATQDEPHLIVLEDLHWTDALSFDLLIELARALANHPVCFMLAYRPLQLEHLRETELELLPAFIKLELSELNQAESEQAIRSKLVQLYPARGGSAPAALVEKLMTRAQGNPFYLEELLNYLRDRGLDPRDPADLLKIELPESLQVLILSRIDQLSEREKTTLRFASIIGRRFSLEWLAGCFPELGSEEQIKQDLDVLNALDITPLDRAETRLVYLFRHVLTHEVTYESLPYAERTILHEQVARYFEDVHSGKPLETLAFHYGRSSNSQKKREYLMKASEAAQKAYAIDAALEYYDQLLPLLDDAREQISINRKRGAVLRLMGNFSEAEVNYRTALNIAQQTRDPAAIAAIQLAIGSICILRSDYEAAMEWLAQAEKGRAALNDQGGLGYVQIQIGTIFFNQGEYPQAREAFQQGLSLLYQASDQAGIAYALNCLGSVAIAQGDYQASWEYIQESLKVHQEIGDKSGVAASLNNLARVAYYQGEYLTGRELSENSLTLYREIGSKSGTAMSLNSLGSALFVLDNPAHAQQLYEEGLALYREIGNKTGLALALNNLGLVNSIQGSYPAAQAYYEESLALCLEIGDKAGMGDAHLGLGLVMLMQALPEGEEPYRAARRQIAASLRLRQEMGAQLPLTSGLVGMALLAIRQAHPALAVRLLGAVDAALKPIHAVIEPVMRYFHAQVLEAAQSALSPAEFQAAWEQGQKLSLEDAVRLALDGEA